MSIFPGRKDGLGWKITFIHRSWVLLWQDGQRFGKNRTSEQVMKRSGVENVWVGLSWAWNVRIFVVLVFFHKRVPTFQEAPYNQVDKWCALLISIGFFFQPPSWFSSKQWGAKWNKDWNTWLQRHDQPSSNADIYHKILLTNVQHLWPFIQCLTLGWNQWAT